MLKAYIVEDKWFEYSIVVFAETSGKARSEAIYNDCFDSSEYIDLRAKRMKEWDKYSETKKIPIAELLACGWWFSCDFCAKQIYQEDVDDGNAFIIDGEDSFVSGRVICKECSRGIQHVGF